MAPLRAGEQVAQPLGVGDPLPVAVQENPFGGVEVHSGIIA
jgi:hypothetical protein